MKKSSIIAAIDEQEADRAHRLGMERDVLSSIPAISGFATMPKASLSAPKKVYACDTGLVSAVEAVDDVNLGHKLENLVYLKIRDPEKTINYFLNDADETECDFIVECRDGSREAIQVTWGLEDDNEAREVNGLKHAMDRFGLKESVLVTRDQEDVIREDGKTVRVLPAWKFLMEGCRGGRNVELAD